MLNELYTGSLISKDFLKDAVQWHNDFHVLPKQEALKIAISDKKPLIASIEKLTEEHVSYLRKWEKNNGWSFPCFNIGPFIPETKEEFEAALLKDKLTSNEISYKFLVRRRGTTPYNLRKKIADKIEGCISSSLLSLKSMLGNPLSEDEPYLPFFYLMDRLAQVGPYKFHYAIARKVAQSISDQPTDWDWLYPLLVFKKKTTGVSVVLEMHNWFENDSWLPVAHEKTHLWINQKLIVASEKESNKIQSINKNHSEQDAYGEILIGQEEKMPKLTLPALPNVILRSMSSESPCQARYRKIESNSFPIGRESRSKTKSFLEWISKKEFKGNTWGILGKNEILFAYPSAFIETPPPIAALMGVAGDENDALKEKTFISLAHMVLEQLRGMRKPLTEIEITLFALKKEDQARTKVLYQLNFTALSLAISAEEWESACINIPLYIHEKIRKNNKIISQIYKIPKPIEFTEEINMHWRNNGFTTIESFKKTVGIDLLLGKVDISGLDFLLHSVLKSHKTLYLALGTENNSDVIYKNLKANAKQKLIAPIALGLLLYKKGYPKEVYMKSQAYNVGVILSATDRLHYLYCKNVRSKGDKIDVPPQLIGNSFMSMALETPRRAVAILGQRLLPYLAWAQTNSTPDAGLSRYLLKKIAEVSKNLAEEPLPVRLNDSEKAIMFLGYMAGVEHASKEKNTEIITSSERGLEDGKE